MKHIGKSLASTALALALTLTACGAKTLPLKAENGGYYDAQNDVSYVMAPMCYEPQGIGDAYASFQSGSNKVILYRVEGLDPTQWLTEEYSGASSMFVASDMALPDLGGFAPDTIHLCVQSISVWEFATVTDQDEIDEVVRLFTEGEAGSLSPQDAGRRPALQILLPAVSGGILQSGLRGLRRRTVSL